MNLNELVNLLGHSLKNKIANDKLKKMGFNILSHEEDYLGVPFHINFTHKQLSIELDFNGYEYFKNKFGEPIRYEEKNEQELILQMINLSNEDSSLSNCKNLMLPFDLKLTDQKSKIIQIIKNDMNCIIRYIGDEYITYTNKNYHIEIHFNETKKIEEIYITLIDLESKIRIKLELELELQRANILKENTREITKIKNPTPDLDWTYQSKLGANKSKIIVEEIFSTLKEQLFNSTLKRDPIGIYYSVKDAIVKFNKAESFGLIIDTDERELLCEAIDELIEATGFQMYGIDITSKWREW